MRIEIKMLPDLALANKVKDMVSPINDYVKEHGCLPEITSENELAIRLFNNMLNIKAFKGLLGYVLLQDDTIICIDSSQWIAQFDGCKESEIEVSYF